MADRYGVISFKVDGEQVAIVGDVTVTFDTRGGEPQTSHQGITGYIEQSVPGTIEVIGVDRPDLDVKALKNKEEATITLEYANGKVIVGRNGKQTNVDGTNPLNGQIPLLFTCDSVEELFA